MVLVFGLTHNAMTFVITQVGIRCILWTPVSVQSHLSEVRFL